MPLTTIDGRVVFVPGARQSDREANEDLTANALSGRSWEGHRIMREVRIAINEEEDINRGEKLRNMLFIIACAGVVVLFALALG